MRHLSSRPFSSVTHQWHISNDRRLVTDASLMRHYTLLAGGCTSLIVTKCVTDRRRCSTMGHWYESLMCLTDAVSLFFKKFSITECVACRHLSKTAQETRWVNELALWWLPKMDPLLCYLVWMASKSHLLCYLNPGVEFHKTWWSNHKSKFKDDGKLERAGHGLANSGSGMVPLSDTWKISRCFVTYHNSMQ